MNDDDCYIYKIEVNDYLYIGSTSDLKRRQHQHNSDIKNCCEYPLYRYCRDNDINKVKLIVLECVQLCYRKQAEQYYIDEFSTGHKLLNCNNVLFDRKLYSQAYRQTHIDIIADYKKAYRQANRDIILEKKKAYYDANKDIILEKAKAYRQANKEKITDYQCAYRAAKKHNN